MRLADPLSSPLDPQPSILDGGRIMPTWHTEIVVLEVTHKSILLAEPNLIGHTNAYAAALA